MELRGFEPLTSFMPLMSGPWPQRGASGRRDPPAYARGSGGASSMVSRSVSIAGLTVLLRTSKTEAYGATPSLLTGAWRRVESVPVRVGHAGGRSRPARKAVPGASRSNTTPLAQAQIGRLRAT